MSTSDLAVDLAALRWRHLRRGWLLLGLFVAVGAGLEAMHGFKVDWYLAVGNETRRLLWRLAHYGIELPPEAAPVLEYAARMFARPAFRQSLSAVEQEMRDDGPAARPPSSETVR